MPKERYVNVSLSFPDEELLARAKERSKAIGISFSKYVNILVERDLEGDPNPMSVRDLIGSFRTSANPHQKLAPIDPNTERGKDVLAKAAIVAAGLTPSAKYPPAPKAASTSESKGARSSQSAKSTSRESASPAKARAQRGADDPKSAP